MQVKNKLVYHLSEERIHFLALSQQNMSFLFRYVNLSVYLTWKVRNNNRSWIFCMLFCCRRILLLLQVGSYIYIYFFFGFWCTNKLTVTAYHHLKMHVHAGVY